MQNKKQILNSFQVMTANGGWQMAYNNNNNFILTPSNPGRLSRSWVCTYICRAMPFISVLDLRPKTKNLLQPLQYF